MIPTILILDDGLVPPRSPFFVVDEVRILFDGKVGNYGFIKKVPTALVSTHNGSMHGFFLLELRSGLH